MTHCSTLPSAWRRSHSPAYSPRCLGCCPACVMVTCKGTRGQGDRGTGAHVFPSSPPAPPRRSSQRPLSDTRPGQGCEGPIGRRPVTEHVTAPEPGGRGSQWDNCRHGLSQAPGARCPPHLLAGLAREQAACWSAPCSHREGVLTAPTTGVCFTGRVHVAETSGTFRAPGGGHVSGTVPRPS